MMSYTSTRIIRRLCLALVCCALLMKYSSATAVFTTLDVTQAFNGYAIAAQGEANAAATTQAIQQRLDYVSNAGGGRVYLPAGTWYINKPLVLDMHSVELVGAGKGVTYLQAASGFTAMQMVADGMSRYFPYQPLQSGNWVSLDGVLDSTAPTGLHGIRTYTELPQGGDHLLVLNSGHNWSSGTAYAVNDTVQVAIGAATVIYVCTTAHTADATNQPSYGANWQSYWVAKVPSDVYFSMDPFSAGAYDATKGRASNWSGMSAYTLDLSFYNNHANTNLPIAGTEWGESVQSIIWTMDNYMGNLRMIYTLTCADGSSISPQIQSSVNCDAVGLYRVIAQFDFANAVLRIWVKAPGSQNFTCIANHRNDSYFPAGAHFQTSAKTSFVFAGYPNGDPYGNGPFLNPPIDRTLCGLHMSNAVRYTDADTCTVLGSGSTPSDNFCYFTNDANTMAYLPLTDNGADLQNSGYLVTQIHGAAAGDSGKIGYGYLCPGAAMSGRTNHRISDMTIVPGPIWGAGVCKWQGLDTKLWNLDIHGGFYAIGDLWYGCTYTADLQNCVLSGTQAGYYGDYSAVRMQNVTIDKCGRYGIYLCGSNADLENVTFLDPVSRQTEYYLAHDGQTYGGQLYFTNLVGTAASGSQYPSLGAIKFTHIYPTLIRMHGAQFANMGPGAAIFDCCKNGTLGGRPYKSLDMAGVSYSGSTIDAFIRNSDPELTGDVYDCISGTPVNNWYKASTPLWSAATTYNSGDVVQYSNLLYQSQINGNRNNNPASTPADWLLLHPTLRLHQNLASGQSPSNTVFWQQDRPIVHFLNAQVGIATEDRCTVAGTPGTWVGIKPMPANQHAPAVTIAKTSSNVFDGGERDTLVATVTDQDNDVDFVEFFLDAATVPFSRVPACGRPSPCSVSTTWMNDGQVHNIIAKAYDSYGNTGSGSMLVNATALFTDDFNDGVVDPAWYFYSGSWSESGGVMTGTGPASLQLPGYNTGNLQITAKVRVNAPFVGPAGICSAYGLNLVFTDATHAALMASQITWGDLQSFVWSPGTWYWFKTQRTYVGQSGSYSNWMYNGKIWPVGSQEPATWTFNFGPTVWYGNNAPGFTMEGTGDSVSYDDITLSNIGNAVPWTGITSPVNNAIIAPGNVTITADAVDIDGTISKVDFYQGVTWLGQSTTSPYSCTWNNAPAGTYALTTVAFDNQGASYTSTAVNLIVDAPAVSLTCPLNGSIYMTPASVAMRATATDSNSTISRVEFYQGSTLLSTCSSSPYQCTWTNISAGSYSLTARAYNTLNAVTTSTPVSISVLTSGPVTFVTTDSSTQGNWKGVYGGDGYNVINDATSYPAYATVSATGNSNWTWDAAPTDVRALQRAATGRIAACWYNASTFTVDMNIADVNPHRVAFYCLDWDNQSRSLTVEVRDANTNNLLDSRTLSDFSAGKYLVWDITGHVKINFINTVGPNSVCSGIFFSTPNTPPTVAITSPNNGAAFVAPATIPLTSNASDSDGSINKVEFYNGGTLLGTCWASPYNFTWTNVAAGSYTLTAKAYDNMNAVTTSGAVNVVSDAPPTVSLTAPAANTNYIAPASVAMTATTSDSDGTISKVEFYQGATLLGTASTSPYNYTWSNAAMGNYSLTAKAYDNYNVATNSSAVNIIVWGTSDVGSVGIAGSASYSSGTFTVSGAGGGVTGTADAFRFVYRQFSGNTTIVARVATAASAVTNERAGVMIRQDLIAGSIEASSLYKPTSTYYAYFLRRTAANGSTSSTSGTAAVFPYWVKLVRSSNTLSAYMSANGTSWTALGYGTTVTMTDPIYVGLAVTSGSTSAAKTVTFDNVSITQP